MEAESPLQRLRRLQAEEEEAREAAAEGRPPGAKPANKGLRAALWAGVVLAFTKLKFLLGLLKFGPTYWTMLLSIWVYSSYYGWPLAAAFVGFILAHELGHGVAALMMGLRVGAPVFIPFFGALIAMKENPRSTWIEAVVGFAGPLVGGLCGAAALLAARLLPEGSHAAGFCTALALITLTINMFNLTPIFGLDGDRVTQPLRFKHWAWGLPVLLALLILLPRPHGAVNPVLLILLIVSGAKAYKARQGPAAPERAIDKLQEADRYVEEGGVTERQRDAAAFAYFGLTTFLAVLVSTVKTPS